jgi:hypothetical protein
MIKVASEIAIGTDLELFLYDNEDKKIVPCVGVLEGTKDAPYKPKGYPDGFAIQEDNVMVEFNIPPAHTPTTFTKSVAIGKRMILDRLTELYGSKYSLYTRKHAHKFRARDLASPQAKRIGCEPDFNAYEGGVQRINPPAPGLDRSCGGHIHLGGDFNCPDFVAALFAELFIGVRCGLAPHKSDPRRKWYGQPGIFRPKPYGIEYRTPNNNWINAPGKIEMIAVYGLQCARFLTNTDAVLLQRAFRKIPWVKVREYMLAARNSEHAAELFAEVISIANEAGVGV